LDGLTGLLFEEFSFGVRDRIEIAEAQSDTLLRVGRDILTTLIPEARADLQHILAYYVALVKVLLIEGCVTWSAQFGKERWS
jgi:hypothetical protein